MGCAKGQQKSGPLSAGPPDSVVFVCCQCQFQASRLVDGGQDPQSPCPGNRTRPVVNPKFAVDITVWTTIVLATVAIMVVRDVSMTRSFQDAQSHEVSETIADGLNPLTISHIPRNSSFKTIGKYRSCAG